MDLSKCIVASCGVPRNCQILSEGIHFFDIANDPNVHAAYLDILGDTIHLEKDSVICSQHFLATDYNARGVLRRGARPTIGVPKVDAAELDDNGHVCDDITLEKRHIAESTRKRVKRTAKTKSHRKFNFHQRSTPEDDLEIADYQEELDRCDEPEFSNPLCVIKGCGNILLPQKESLQFFPCPCPPSNDDFEEIHLFYRKWFVASGHEAPEEFCSYDAICSLHFQPAEFITTKGRMTLDPTAYPTQLLPKDVAEFAEENAVNAAFLMKQLEMSCRLRWEEISSPDYNPPHLKSGYPNWSVYEEDDICVVFGRARKRQIPGGGILPFAVDFIRLDRDMTVSLSIDNVAIPFDKFSHLLHDGKAVTIRQTTLTIFDRQVNGIMSAIFQQSYTHSTFSRGVCGTRKDTLVIDFPASPKACCQCFTLIQPKLGHIIDMQRKNTVSI